MIAELLLACRITTVAVHPPDFSYSRRMYDGGVVMPRYAWHLSRAATSAAVTFVLTKGLKVSPKASAASAAFFVGLLPHVIGVTTCRYPFDPTDWTADLVIASAPLAVVDVHGVDLIFHIAIFSTGYMLTSPFASP